MLRRSASIAVQSSYKYQRFNTEASGIKEDIPASKDAKTSKRSKASSKISKTSKTTSKKDKASKTKTKKSPKVKLGYEPNVQLPFQEIDDDDDDLDENGVPYPVLRKPKIRLDEPFDLHFVVNLLRERKLEDIFVLDISEKVNWYKYFIIATGRSGSHLNTVASSLSHEAKKRISTESFKIHQKGSNFWVIFTCTDQMIVNLFTEEEREEYDLERVWTLRRKKKILWLQISMTLLKLSGFTTKKMVSLIIGTLWIRRLKRI